MELNSSVNTFIGGMNLDSDISLLKENQYTYAENIRLLANEDSTTGILLNRDCLKKFESFLRNGEIILGTVVTRLYKDNESRECIVAITLYNNLNSIYIIYINEYSNEWVEWEPFILDKNIGWINKLKIVANYESDTVSKLYIVDGFNYIKVVNLNTVYNDVSSDSFDIAPNVFLNKPHLLKMINGNLEVGAVQYAYQLFTKHGAESPISPVSELISIPKKIGEYSTDVYGGNKSELSNLGCSIKIEFEETQTFDHVRIYRIKYESNNSIPRVYIISETEINDNYIIYNDVNDAIISEITVDEFNALTLKTFVPQTIEKHENRLFAANIKENVWDPEYDARAYRCDMFGDVLLNHSDSTLNIYATISEVMTEGFVSTTHDCINPSNEILFDVDSFKYIYGLKDGEYVVGGSGPNVSYEFCFTDVACSSDNPLKYSTSDAPADYKWQPKYSLELNNNIYTSDVIEIRDANQNYITGVTVNDSVALNYADSYFTANFLGYHRDEIYRFGIIFYNEKGQSSKVHWIGDIRMPSHMMDNYLSGTWKPFYFANDYYKDTQQSVPETKELLGKAMGIKFTVKNVPQDVVSWEIVRCPRTEIDRTIVTQAYLGKLIQFDGWDDGDRTPDPNFGDSDIRPMALLNTSSEYRILNWDDGHDFYHTFNTLDNYYELISPEISVNKQGIVDNIKSGKVCNLYSVESRFHREYVSDHDYYTSETMWGVRQVQLYPLSDEADNIVRNIPGLGAFKVKDNIEYFAFGVTEPAATENIGPSVITYGGAILLKYYKYNEMYPSLISCSIDNAIYPTILPLIYDNEQAKSYSQPIGTKIYTNTTVGGVHQLNTHGSCVIINTDSSATRMSERQTTEVVNIKQQGVLYGGNNYSTRTNSTYISCASHKVDEETVCVFGGDTYIGVFDYVHTSMRQWENDPNNKKGYPLFVNCYLPIESTVNMYLFNNEQYKNTVKDDTIGQNLLLNEPTVTANYAQTKPLYEYNSVYSTDANALIFVPDLLYTDENPIFETRIVCSELKTNNEIIDSWTKFKFANYLDADNQYGPVTNLKSFNGKLLFWQDSAVGVASVNERSLIQDNNISMLTLGTGGILVRYDYYTTLNGSFISNDRSICNSISTLYWYDPSKKEICAINNTVIELSKVKGVKSWSNKLHKIDSLGWYDWKYNEILFLNETDESDRSIVFNEQLNVFTGFYTYPVKHVAQMVDNIVTIDSQGNLYLHKADTNYEPFESKIIYTINKGYPETKVFDNVWFDAEFSTDEVLKSVVFKTKTQETNPISFNEIENREDTYRFPIPRDKNGVARMRGKYLICDYTFDCINDGDFKIPYIKTTFRISRV